jgi:hypothetical protein
VNEVEWDANHCENSENIFFWDKLCFCITLDNVLEALIAFFHDNTRKIMLILDDINDFANHWVFKRPKSTYFTFSFSQQVLFLKILANLIL